MSKTFKYTGKAVSLDNHDSDYYESSNWTICVWDGEVINSKMGLRGELESNNVHYHFFIHDGLLAVNRVLVDNYNGLGKRYVEGHANFPIPKYVCNFIKELEGKYILK